MFENAGVKRESVSIFSIRYLKFVSLTMVGIGILIVIMLLGGQVKGELTISTDDAAPGWVNESSVQVCMFNITAHNNTQGAGNEINWVNITLFNASDFDPNDDLAALANDITSGVSIYQENSVSAGFQADEDVRAGTVGSWFGNGTFWNVNITFGPGVTIPDNNPATPNFYIIIRTSAAIGNGSQFNMSINTSAINSSYGEVPANAISSSVTEADTVAPGVPSNMQFSGDANDIPGDGFGPQSNFNDDLLVDLSWNAASDPGGSGISHYRIGTAWGQTGGNYSEDDDYTVNSDGNYTLYICAVDEMGHNSTEVAMVNWVICNTTLPTGTISVTELSDLDFLYYDSGNDELYYTDHEGDFNISAQFSGWQSYEYGVRFDTSFGEGPNNDLNAPYDSATYSIGAGDTDSSVTVKLIDMAGNVGYVNLTCTRDTWGPNITSHTVSENSHFIYYNVTTIYYGDDMQNAQSFTISGNGQENLSGLWKMVFASNALGSPADDPTPASWAGTYDSVGSADNVQGNLTITLHDRVNNTGTFNYTLVRDTTAPQITDGDWNETSGFLYVLLTNDNTDNIIYYGSGMGAGFVDATISFSFSDNFNLSNVTYSVGPGVDQQTDQIIEKSDNATAIYSFNNGDSFNGALTVTVTDRCGNQLVDSSSFVITRDVTGPAIASYTANENSNFLFVSGTTIFYSNRMSAEQAFNVTGTATDAGAGLLNCTFSSNALGSPNNDGSPATWLGKYAGVGNADSWQGVITITFYDMVNNSANCTFNVTRDTELPGVTISNIGESSKYINYDNSVLFYSNNQAMAESFTIRITDSEAGSGRLKAEGENELGDTPTDNDYGGIWWELQYTINQGETCNGDSIIITIYDKVGNTNTTNLSVTIDNQAPVPSLLTISESSINLYFDSNNAFLYYSNDQGMTDSFTIFITDDESGCGRQKAEGEAAFSESPSDNSYDGNVWQIQYTISQSETCDGTITITVYDNCDNNGTYNLTVILDNTSPTLTVSTVVTTGDNVYWNGSTLFFSSDQAMADTFEIRTTDNEAGSGRQNASGESAFGDTPTDSDYTNGNYWSLTYTINVDENSDGSLTINVSDKCGNWNTTTLTVTRDNAKPSLSNFALTETPDFARWGMKWFDPEIIQNGIFHFTWTNSDADSGLGTGEMNWDSSNDGDDNLSQNTGIGGTYIAYDVGDDSTGNITVTLYIYDHVNNMNSSNMTFNFDANNPDNLAIPNINELTNGSNIYYNSGSKDLYYNNSAAIMFQLVVTFDDTGSGRNQSHGPSIFADSPTNNSYQSGHYLDYTIEVSWIDAGTFKVTVYDNVGRNSTIQFDLTLDTTSPTVTDTSLSEVLHPGNLYYNSTSKVFYYNNSVNEPQFDIRVQCSDATAGLYRSVGETRFGDSPTDSSYSSRYDLSYSIEKQNVFNGTINVTIYDRVNNYAITVVNIRRDVYAPKTPTNIRCDPDDQKTYYKYDDDATVFLYWTPVMDDQGGSDINMYYAQIDNPNPVNDSLDNRHHSETKGEGNNTFYLTVADNVGNYCPVGSDWIVVDTGVPTIDGITVSSDDTWYYSTGIHAANGGDVWFNSNAGEGALQTITITFSWTEPYKDKVNVTSVFGGQKYDDFNGVDGWNIPFKVLQGQGSDLSLVLWVVDKANNTDTVVINFKVDNDDPAAPTGVQCRPDGPGGVGEYSNGTSIWVTWADAQNDGAGCGWKENRMGTDPATMNNIVHVSGESEVGNEGLATFYVFAVDNVGNYLRVSDTITIDLTNPVISSLKVFSSKRYYYNESLGPGGGDVWFNSLTGMGAGQNLTLSFQWNEVNKENISGSIAFGSSPVTAAAPWNLSYIVPINENDVDVKVTLWDKANRSVFITIHFKVDNQNPVSSGFEIWDNTSSFVYYDHADNILYYSGKMSQEQPINFTTLGVSDLLSNVANVTFQAAFGQLEGVIGAAPYTISYGINFTDNFEGPLTITVYDNVGNYFNLSLNVTRDTEVPYITKVLVGENSKYLYYDLDENILYYSDKMSTGQEFYVHFNGSGDNESGLYGVYCPTEFSLMEDFSAALPYNISYFVTAPDTFNGTLTFNMHDLVNNSYEWKFTVVRDVEAPEATFRVNESSSFIHYGLNDILYYGDDMIGQESFEITIPFSFDNLSGVGGVLFPKAFNRLVSDDPVFPYSCEYGVNFTSMETGIINIEIYDRTYNKLILSLEVIRDIEAPAGMINISESSAFMFYDETGGIFYYSAGMSAAEWFRIAIVSANDNDSGLYRAIFPGIFNWDSQETDEQLPYELTYNVENTMNLTGWVNISVVDYVGNALVLPVMLIRDTTAPTFSKFDFDESSTFLHYDAPTLYYNNEFFKRSVDFTAFFTNISDDLSGYLEVRYPTIFSTMESFSSAWNYAYSLNISDENPGLVEFILYDRVGNVRSFMLNITLDDVTPKMGSFVFFEKSEYIHPEYRGANKVWLWYADFDSAQWFELSINNITDGSSGISRIDVPALFKYDSFVETEISHDFVHNFSVEPGSTFNESRAFYIFDNVNNSIQVLITVKRDNTISVDPVYVEILEESDYIHYDPKSFTLYYGKGFSEDQNFTVIFKSRSVEEIGAGFGKVESPAIFSELQRGAKTVQYLISGNSDMNGDFDFRVFDNVSNMAVFTITIDQDREKPIGQITLNGKSSERTAKTEKFHINVGFELVNDAKSGIREYFFSNDNSTWVSVSHKDGFKKWDFRGKGFDKESDSKHTVYLKVVDNVSNVWIEPLSVQYIAPVKVPLAEAIPFVFGVLGFFGWYGLIMVGIMIVGMFLFVGRKKRKREEMVKKPDVAEPLGTLPKEEIEESPEISMDYTPVQESPSLEYPWSAEEEEKEEVYFDMADEHVGDEMTLWKEGASIIVEADFVEETGGDEVADESWGGEIEEADDQSEDVGSWGGVIGEADDHSIDAGSWNEVDTDVGGRKEEGDGWDSVETIDDDPMKESASWADAGTEESVVAGTAQHDVETVFEARSHEGGGWEAAQSADETETVEGEGWEVEREVDKGPGRDFDISAQEDKSDAGIDKTVDDIIGLLGGQEEEESIESALLTPSLLRIKRPSLCVNCKKIIKKGLSGLRCPNCSKVMHMECGKGIGKCPECGAGFK